MDAGTFFFLLLILIVVIVVALWTMVVQVEQYESGVALRLGKFHTMLNPGWNFVVPLITVVYKIDLRIQVLDVPRQEVITKDNSPKWWMLWFTTELQMLRKQYLSLIHI